MNCEDYRQIVSARIDGHASGREVEALDAHLRECVPCSEADRALRALHAGFASSDPAPSPAFRAALFERLETEGLLPERKGRLISFPFLRWAAVPLAAAAGFALFLMVGRESAPVRSADSSPAPRVASREAPAQPVAAGNPASGSPAAVAAVPKGRPSTAASGPGSVAAASGGHPPLSAEEAEIVANIDLFDDPAALDAALSDIDDLPAAGARSRG
jgi:hypothetical protein